MEIPCQQRDVYDTLSSIDGAVEKIQQRQFAVLTPPNAEICNLCDLRHLCKQEKIIGR
jgi:CRISPR/Cas system-associated exonuclease Cas4 (RecB family)